MYLIHFCFTIRLFVIKFDLLCTIPREAPTGLEDDDDLECENMQWNGSDMASSDETQKSHRRRHWRHKPDGSSQKTLSWTLSRSFSCDSHSKGSVSPAFAPTKVDLSKLELKALWRYWRHFNLMDVAPDPTREQLINVVRQHFMSQQLDELQVIVGFSKAAKRLRTLTSRHKSF
ncbi:hypothetical protein ACHQM5_023236 [Ranunculus cassubicifolius]